MTRFVVLLACYSLLSPQLSAQEMPTPKDLPPTPQAIAAIDQSPAVLEARSALAAAGYNATALATGSHEWTARAVAQRRSYRDGATSNEWSVQIERGIRVGGKAALDRELGETGAAIAQARVAEARHEAARTLADLWLDWLRSDREFELLKTQVTFAQTNLATVEKRKRAGDASGLDLSVAQIDLADVLRQQSLTDTNLSKARAKLRLRFPQVPTNTVAMSEPEPPVKTEAFWRERIVSEADPIKIAEFQLRSAELQSKRASADRLPDPTVGVFTASEAFRNERVVGLSISIPLAGTYRHARAQQALLEIDVARAARNRQQQLVELEVAETHADAVGSTQRWRLSEQGANAARDSAQLMQRAYSLGEADLQSLLLVRRQALDAQRAALDARHQALRWNYRLLIDAHLIWDLAND